MKLLSLAVPAALLVFACTAGTGTLSTGTGPDPSPTSGDRPPSSTDHPPSSTDPSGADCLKCEGSFVCRKGSDQTEVDLTVVNGVCQISSPGGHDSSTLDPCTGVVIGDGVTVKRSSDGIQVCVPDVTIISNLDGGTTTTTRTVCSDCPAGTAPPKPQPKPQGQPDAG